MTGLKLALLVLATMLSTITACGDLGAILSSAKDNQTVEITGHEYIKSLDLSKNVTLVGVGDNATVDGSKLKSEPMIGVPGHHTTVTLDNLVVQDCMHIYDNANLKITNCKFIRSELDAHDCTVYAKNTGFSRSINGTNIGEGGAVSLYKVMAVMDKCAFVGNSAFRNGTWSGGSGGGLRIDNSTVTLIDPTIRDNIAAFGGGICVVNSTLAIYGGRIMRNRAIPVNYTNPVSYFGGEGGAISAVRSKVLLAHTYIANNPSRYHHRPIWAKDSDIRTIDSLILH